MKRNVFSALCALTACAALSLVVPAMADDMSSMPGMNMSHAAPAAKPAPAHSPSAAHKAPIAKKFAAKNAAAKKLAAKKAAPAHAKAPVKPAHKMSAKPVAKKSAAAVKYECVKCHMQYSAADAAKYHFVDPMDGGKLVAVKK